MLREIDSAWAKVPVCHTPSLYCPVWVMPFLTPASFLRVLEALLAPQALGAMMEHLAHPAHQVALALRALRGFKGRR